MAPGTKVYLNWYDFNKKTEFLLKGEVVDNSDYQGTQWADFVYVSIQLNGMSAPICHHFLPQQLSTDASNVPHDECYLVCGKKSRFFEHDTANKLKNDGKYNPSEAWQQAQQFKQDHWDYEHGHLSVDALDEHYRLWHDAIAAKRGITQPYSGITQPCSGITQPYSFSKPAEAPSKPKRKQQKPQQQVIELSLFD